MKAESTTEPILESYTMPDIMGWDQQIAQIVTQICSPPLTTLAAAFLIASVLSTATAWFWALLYGFLVIIVPTIYVFYLVKKGEITDLHMRVREQRMKPLLLTLFCAFTVMIASYLASAPRLFIIFSVANFIQMSFFLAITFHWKISFHCTSAASLAVLGIAILNKNAASIFLLILPLIAWSRIILKRHTPGQTLAGTALGYTIFTFAMIIYGG